MFYEQLITYLLKSLHSIFCLLFVWRPTRSATITAIVNRLINWKRRAETLLEKTVRPPLNAIYDRVSRPHARTHTRTESWKSIRRHLCVCKREP